MLTANPRGVLTGVHFINGDLACCEGAIAAGCRIAFGYPITPSTEVVERIASRFPMVGGVFIQLEDEIASSIAIQGAVWGGKKALTASSGPGISLMMEHVGYAAMTETPCVFVNVQRGGPSTGLPTLVAQGDVMQARWGSHGDYEVIALSPNSPQECFDLCIEAFNLSERYRVPVFFLMDESVGHMVERVVIPEPGQIRIEPRRMTSLPPGQYLPYRPGPDGVPEMCPLGEGYRIHVTGLTHDERGYPVISAEAQQKLVGRLVGKIRNNARDICMLEEQDVDSAEAIIVSYGITSRVVMRTMELARKKGLPVGSLRLVTIWPFPEWRIRELAEKVKAFVVPELNLGQIVFEVERLAAGRARVQAVPHAGGELLDPEKILGVVEDVLK
ncbi:MAG: 2-oxoacid:acceptor oxidoreductase subunit alpha [Deltaproteobacteria bacterium]|nr:MAG: 2-oxoacid:acceptor oxidoreductase subunit alpha [Deltaproteobacteria bacterium]